MMRTRAVIQLVSLLLVAHVVVARASCPRNEDGVRQAMRGKVTGAESVFVCRAAASPHDPRALNNLGNTYLLLDNLDSAMARYNLAMKYDSNDAGIRLNRAIVWWMWGDSAKALDEAAEAVRLAGGEKEAAARIGLLDEDNTEKAAEPARITQTEVRDMLRLAARRASRRPPPPQPDSATGGASKKLGERGSMRSAGVRGADITDAATVFHLLYWKY